jgi:hypothetical protein
MYGFSAFFNIISALSWQDEPLGYNWRFVTTDHGYLKMIFTLPFSFLWAVLANIFSRLFSCLPKWMQRSIYFFIRYTGKWGYHKKASVRIKLRQASSRVPYELFKKKGTDRTLANALRYDIVLLIAPKVHYVDLVNLSMVSKQVRATMFPISEAEDQERGLRLYSCYGNRKSECWTCGIQICNVSSLSPCSTKTNG